MKVLVHTWNYAGTFYFWPAMSVSSLIPPQRGYFFTISFLFRYIQITIDYSPDDIDDIEWPDL